MLQGQQRSVLSDARSGRVYPCPEGKPREGGSQPSPEGSSEAFLPDARSGRAAPCPEGKPREGVT